MSGASASTTAKKMESVALSRDVERLSMIIQEPFRGVSGEPSCAGRLGAQLPAQVREARVVKLSIKRETDIRRRETLP
jgi:hypothetical protein